MGGATYITRTCRRSRTSCRGGVKEQTSKKQRGLVTAACLLCMCELLCDVMRVCVCVSVLERKQTNCRRKSNKTYRNTTNCCVNKQSNKQKWAFRATVPPVLLSSCTLQQTTFIYTNRTHGMTCQNRGYVHSSFILTLFRP